MCVAGPGGDAHDESELHQWWAAGAREGEEGGGASVLAVATGGSGAHGHIELLGEGELRDMLRREVRAGVGRRGDEWAQQGREAANEAGTICLRYQGADVAGAWGGRGKLVGGPTTRACDCSSASVTPSDVLNMDVVGYERGGGEGKGGKTAAGGGEREPAHVHYLGGAGRWARMGDVMRDAVVTGGAVLVQGGHDGRALAAARQEWAAWLSSGAGGRITPSGSNGGAVDIRKFVGSEAGSGWFKTFGLGTDDRGDEGPVVRWADTGLGRGAHWLRRARQHMRGAGIEGIHVDASVREVTFMASGSPPDSGEVHFDEFDSLSVVVHGGKTWFFLADADMTREYGAHPEGQGR